MKVNVRRHLRRTQRGKCVVREHCRSIPELKFKTFNRLPIQVGVIVPSTKLNKPIHKNTFDKRIKDTRNFFTRRFGGDIAVKQEGGYQYKTRHGKKLISEKGVMVTSSMSEDAYLKNKARIERFIVNKQKDWKQDTIGYQVEGNFYTYPYRDYILHDKKNKNIMVS